MAGGPLLQHEIEYYKYASSLLFSLFSSLLSSPLLVPFHCVCSPFPLHICHPRSILIYYRYFMNATPKSEAECREKLNNEFLTPRGLQYLSHLLETSQFEFKVTYFSFSILIF